MLDWRLCVMKATHTVSYTANFENNLEEIDWFLRDIDSRQFDELLDTLENTVIPNLERFPSMGKSLLMRPTRSIEVGNSAAVLAGHLDTIMNGGEVREYSIEGHLILYAHLKEEVLLLSVRHERHVSFDIASHWNT